MYCSRDFQLTSRYFHQDSTIEPTELTEEDNTQNDILHPSSGWTPPSGQDPLYTNIPHTEGIQAQKRILEETNTDPMKKLLTYRLANLVLTKNYFSFKKQFYRQTQGTAVGTRMAPSYANIFMKYTETQLIDTSPKKPKMWLRFIDDIFMIWGHGRHALEDFLHLANNIHPNIKFSFNTNVQEIPFLDTIIYGRNNSHILTRLYHKPTDNKQYLHFNAGHSWKQKKVYLMDYC